MKEIILDVLMLLLLLVVFVGGIVLMLVASTLTILILIPIMGLYYTMKTIEDIWDLIS